MSATGWLAELAGRLALVVVVVVGAVVAASRAQPRQAWLAWTRHSYSVQGSAVYVWEGTRAVRVARLSGASMLVWADAATLAWTGWRGVPARPSVYVWPGSTRAIFSLPPNESLSELTAYGGGRLAWTVEGRTLWTWRSESDAAPVVTPPGNLLRVQRLSSGGLLLEGTDALGGNRLSSQIVSGDTVSAAPSGVFDVAADGRSARLVERGEGYALVVEAAGTRTVVLEEVGTYIGSVAWLANGWLTWQREDGAARWIGRWDGERVEEAASLAGQAPRDLMWSREGAAAWGVYSPDDGSADLYLWTDATTPTVIESPAGEMPGAWSPDGRLAYRVDSVTTQALIVWTEGAAPVMIADSIDTSAQPAWSADGRLAWLDKAGEMWVWDGVRRMRIVQPPGAYTYSPVWSP